MNRILIGLLLLLACLSSCTKSDDVLSQQKAQATIDEKIISTYLKSKGLPEQHVDTSGVCYVVDTAGAANTVYTSASSVTLGYIGWQLTSNSTLGKVITTTAVDTAYNFHPSFILGQVILGWQLGIPKVGQGGSVTLFLPSRYAYGPYPQPDIGLPANAVLVFHITVYNVSN